MIPPLYPPIIGITIIIFIVTTLPMLLLIITMIIINICQEMGCFGDQESCVKDCAACPNGLGDEELCR